MASQKILQVSNFIKFPLIGKPVRYAHRKAKVSYEQTVRNLPEVKVSTLDNGLKVASQYCDSKTSAVGLWIDAGSRYETDKNNGVANLFEHLAFKGTQKRSEKDLVQEVENMGAYVGTYTGREETAFYAKCLSSDVPKAVDIISDVIQNSKMSAQQADVEKNVILRELEDIEKDLKQVTLDYLHLTAYQGTPLGKSVFGSTDSIKNLTVSDVEHYVKSNFIAPRMVLAGCGNFEHDELVKVAQKFLGSVPFTPPDEIQSLTNCRFTGSEVRVRDDWYPFAHVAVAVNTDGINCPDNCALTLAKQVVGCWDKSLASSADTVNSLIQNVYKGKGCHSFEAFHTLYRDTGLWGAYFVVDGLSIDDFLYNLQTEWMKLCHSIKESDLTIAKKMLKSDLFIQNEAVVSRCADIGRQVLFCGKHYSLAEVNDTIDNISLQKLKDVCMKYIYDRCPAVAGVGPVEGLPDYTRVRANMYWLRY